MFGVPDFWWTMVDVGDAATAHLRVAETQNSHGRFILAHSETHGLVEIARILRSISQSFRIPQNKVPDILVRLSVPLLGFSQKYLKQNLGIPFDVDNRPSMDEMNIVYRPLKETLVDHYECWKGAQN
jgi:hypothetical protein